MTTGPSRRSVVAHCRVEDRVDTVQGAEDITIDPTSGVAFVSARNLHKKRIPGSKVVPADAIYAYDLEAARAQPRDLTSRLGLDFDFHPHGIGLWVEPDSERRLFVVNHRTKRNHTVEIFRYKDEGLIHLETIPEDPELLYMPNDLVPVGPRSFYVTNHVGSRSGPGQLVEMIFGQPKSFVLFYDGTRYHKVVEGLRYANGINVSHDGRTVFVTTTRGHEVLFYRREADGSLTHERTIEVNTGADNLELDEHGDLWIGAHPRASAFLLYATVRWGKPPSQVIRIPYQAGEYGHPEEVYRNDGRPLPASSVAAVYKDKLLIGSVFDGFLVCTLTR